MVNKMRNALLHRMPFGGHKIRAAKFSPDGKFVAIGVGKKLEVGLSICCLVIMSTHVAYASSGVNQGVCRCGRAPARARLHLPWKFTEPTMAAKLT